MLLIFPIPITYPIHGILLDSITLIIFGEEYHLWSLPAPPKKRREEFNRQFLWPPGPACWKIDVVCVCLDPLAYKGRWQVWRSSYRMSPRRFAAYQELWAVTLIFDVCCKIYIKAYSLVRNGTRSCVISGILGLRDFRMLPSCRWCLHSVELLRGVCLRLFRSWRWDR
jgi:hypothetical protein